MAAAHPTRSTLDGAVNDGSGVRRGVPAAEAERPVSVQLADLRRSVRQ